jgi:hypothetical protein
MAISAINMNVPVVVLLFMTSSCSKKNASFHWTKPNKKTLSAFGAEAGAEAGIDFERVYCFECDVFSAFQSSVI